MTLFPMLAPLAPLQEAVPESMTTGLEWMPIASFIVPALLLLVIFYIGRKTTVGGSY